MSKNTLGTIIFFLLISFVFIGIFIKEYYDNKYFYEVIIPYIENTAKFIDENDLIGIIRISDKIKGKESPGPIIYEGKLGDYYKNNSEEQKKLKEMNIAYIYYNKECFGLAVTFTTSNALLGDSDYYFMYKKGFYKGKRVWDFVDKNESVSIVKIFNDDFGILDGCDGTCD